MASIPPINRIVKEDFPGEPWAEKLLWPINRFMESVVSGFNNNLTFSENMLGQTKQLQFEANNFPLKFAPRVVRPTDMWISSLRRVDGTTTTNAVSMDWEVGDDGSVVVNNITGLAAGEEYIIRFVLVQDPGVE